MCAGKQFAASRVAAFPIHPGTASIGKID